MIRKFLCFSSNFDLRIAPKHRYYKTNNFSVDEASQILNKVAASHPTGPAVDPSTQNQCFVKRTIPESVCA